MRVSHAGRQSSLAVRLLVAAPELVASAVAGFTIGPMILLLANHFSLGLGAVVGLLGAAVALVVHGLPRESATPGEALLCGLAVAFVLWWIVANLHYAGENVYAIRDPSTYAIAGHWLTDHDSLAIHAHPEIFGQPPGARGVVSGGFNNIAHIPIVYAQGNHLLPVMLAMSTVVGGSQAVFTGNIVFGGLALLAFFGLGRRVTHSAGLALLATVALGISIPMVYVSRDTFSEPLTMLFLVGGLALLVRGTSRHSIRDYGLAGFVGSCSAMVRVDSDVALLGFVAGAVIICGLAPRGQRRRPVLCAAAIVAGGAGPTLMGWLDVRWLSREYYWSLHSNIVMINFALLTATFVVAPVCVWVLWQPRLQRWLSAPPIARRAWLALAAAVVLAMVFLASRPLWQQVRGHRVDAAIEAMQRGSGLPVDGHRIYSEQTVSWLGMYFGWPTVILAVIGYCVLLRQLIVDRRVAIAAPLCAGLALSAVYLYNPQIYPDQPWAMRRFVPIVLPMLLIAAVTGLRLLGRLTLGRERIAARHARAQPWLRRGALLLTVLGTVLLLAVPLAVLRPVWKIRQEGGQYPQLAALCKALPQNAAVVATDAAAQTGYGQTLRTYCDVPTFGLPGASQVTLAAMNAAVRRSGRTLFALASGPDTYTYAPDSGPQAYSTVTTSRWTTHLGRVPSGPRYDCITVYLAQIDESGLAHTVSGGPVTLTGPCAV